MTACVLVLIIKETKKNAPNSIKLMAIHSLNSRHKLPDRQNTEKNEGRDMTGVTLIEQALVCILGVENK